MKSSKIAAALLLSSLMLACQDQTPKFGPPFIPPAGQHLVFVDHLSFPGYSQQNMPRTFGIAFYASLLKNVSFEATPGNRIDHLDTLLAALPKTPVLVMLRFTNSQLKMLPTGDLDEKILQLAQSIKSYQIPVYLAPGFEVNNPRFDLAPERFVNGYRYFVDKMRGHEVTNVTFIWHIIAMKPRWDEAIPLDACYPGDDYVDWLGLSVHNITPNHFPDDSYFASPIYDAVADFARAHDLPVMVCESSTRSVSKNFGFTGDSLWVDWYEPFFNLIRKYDIRAFSHTFYDYDDDLVLKKWRQEIEKGHYILAHPHPIDIKDEE